VYLRLQYIGINSWIADGWLEWMHKELYVLKGKSNKREFPMPIWRMLRLHQICEVEVQNHELEMFEMGVYW